MQRAARPPSSWVVENDGRSHVTSLNLSFFTHKRGDGYLHGGRSRGGGQTTGMLECAPKPTSRHVQSWPLTRRVPGKTHQVASTRVVLLSGALLKAPGTNWSQLPTPPPPKTSCLSETRPGRGRILGHSQSPDADLLTPFPFLLYNQGALGGLPLVSAPVSPWKKGLLRALQLQSGPRGIKHLPSQPHHRPPLRQPRAAASAAVVRGPETILRAV